MMTSPSRSASFSNVPWRGTAQAGGLARGGAPGSDAAPSPSAVTSGDAYEHPSNQEEGTWVPLGWGQWWVVRGGLRGQLAAGAK